MYKNLRAARDTESGFTLVELLIVIVILGELAGVVVFAVGAFQGDGVAAACKSDLKNVEIASEAYYAKKSTHASAIDDDTHSATTLVGAGYLKQAPSSTKYTIAYAAATGNATSAC
jgi:prepilin-type N-terminal cleavage/methylation domain-containing protein